ncbi:cupin domain-containing protein [Saccharothrix lopnurensis]|uniref:Cupin domain-containing protein n=1 Tax=Saccharothrix lopnurensis TaxID=1670621 RepID=A0ABW1PHU1_9PSEU
MTTTENDLLPVIHAKAGQGQAVWFGDAIYSFKATKATTNGALTFAEASVPPGGGPPPHVHPHADEAFFILSGELEFLNGQETFLAGEGDFVYIPRGTRHRFRNVGLHVSRLLFLFTPSTGMENFFSAIGTPARPGIAPLPLTPEQQRQIVELAPEHDLRLAL